tara:strand:+ start:473 stop:691 length:219 start_codon:yes stop_codon:yes gene_type:complete
MIVTSEMLVEKVYLLCNGMRDTPEVCRMIFGEGHGPETKTSQWNSVCIAVDILIKNGDIHMKDSGILLDLWR